MEVILEELKKINFKVQPWRKNVGEPYEYLILGLNEARYKGVCESKNNEKYKVLYDLLKEEIKKVDEKFNYTSIIINKNHKCKAHYDNKNIFKSYIIGLGDYEGGKLNIEGKKYDIKNKWLKFNGGKKKHWTEDFTGDRYSIVFYTNDYCNRKIIEVKNLKFRIRNHTTDNKVIDEVIKRNVYEKYFKIEEDDIWLDLGGNIGTFSVLAGRTCQKVYSYEPEKTNQNLLKVNIKLNEIKNVRLSPFAISYKGEEDKLFLCNTDYNKYQHSLTQTTKKKFVKIESRKFDKILNKNINCVKIDIEGNEMEILENWDKYKNSKNIKKLVFEWSFNVDNKVNRLLKVIELLKKHFENVKYPNQIDNMKDMEYNFYPSGILVYCWK